MDLIPRYLQAIRFWLPRKQQDDIIAEISQDLSDQIEEQQSHLGRPLNELEIETLLRRRGAPLAVANRYLPQHSLIGPLLFPIYLFVLKVVSLVILIPAGVGAIASLVAGALHGVSGASWEPPFAGIAGHLWTGWFSALGVVTIVFAVLERSHVRTQILERWNPRKLPPVRPAHAIPRSSSGIEIAVNLCVLVWWIGNMASPVGLRFGAVHLSFTPAWVFFFWGILLLTAASTIIAVVNLMRPYWTARRIAARLCLDVAGSIIFCWMLRANLIAAIVWPGANPEKAAQVIAQVNLWLGRMFPYAIAVCIVITAINAWKLVRIIRKQGTPSLQAAVV